MENQRPIQLSAAAFTHHREFLRGPALLSVLPTATPNVDVGGAVRTALSNIAAYEPCDAFPHSGTGARSLLLTVLVPHAAVPLDVSRYLSTMLPLRSAPAVGSFTLPSWTIDCAPWVESYDERCLLMHSTVALDRRSAAVTLALLHRAPLTTTLVLDPASEPVTFVDDVAKAARYLSGESQQTPALRKLFQVNVNADVGGWRDRVFYDEDEDEENTDSCGTLSKAGIAAVTSFFQGREIGITAPRRSPSSSFECLLRAALQVGLPVTSIDATTIHGLTQRALDAIAALPSLRSLKIASFPAMNTFDFSTLRSLRSVYLLDSVYQTEHLVKKLLDSPALCRLTVRCDDEEMQRIDAMRGTWAGRFEVIRSCPPGLRASTTWSRPFPPAVVPTPSDCMSVPLPS